LSSGANLQGGSSAEPVRGSLVGAVAFLVCAVAGYAVGKQRGRAASGLVLGLVLGPIGVGVMACLGATSATAPATSGTAASGQRCFYVVEAILGLPVFLTVLTVIAIHATPDRSARPVGVGAVVVALLLVGFGLRANYVAVVGLDGSLTFKSLVSSTVTSVLDVRRLTVRAAGGRGGGGMWSFDYGGGTAKLNGSAGRALARYLVNQNPSISHPPRLAGQWGSSLRA
jgi:hypothetical protein